MSATDSHIRHIVLLRWSEAPSADRLAALEAALGRLPSLLTGMRSYDFGSDLGLAEGNFDFAIVGDFDDIESYGLYASHPEHQRIIAEQIRPMLGERVAIQVDVPAAP